MASPVVLVKHISALINEAMITELFSCCGTIKSCEMSRASDGSQSAVITYPDATQATAAVALSGTTLGDCAFTVINQADAVPEPVSTTVGAPATMPDLSSAPTSTPGVSIPGANPNVQDQLMQAQLKREEEISRTVYVGNLVPNITEEELAEFLTSCGEVTCVKHCGNTVGDGEATVRYSFVEFATRQGALTAMGIGGTLLMGRPIKVGKALNPIIKNAKTMAKKVTAKKLSMTSDIMRRVMMHASRIGQKVEEPKNGSSREQKEDRARDRGRDRSRDRSRSRDRRRRSRDRDRRRRDGDKRRRRRSRSDSRDRGGRRR